MKYTGLKCTALLLLLSACTTPSTILQDKSGKVVICGGHNGASFLGGAIGYHMQQNADIECVNRMQSDGYEIKAITK